MRVLAQKLGESLFPFPSPPTQTTHHCARTLMVKPMPTKNQHKPTTTWVMRVLEHILEDPPKFFHS